MKQMKAALGKSGTVKPRPRFATMILERRVRTLDDLKAGIEVRDTQGDDMLITFKAKGRPFKVRMGTGWKGIKVVSSLGAVSTLLIENTPTASGMVSGMLRLRR